MRKKILFIFIFILFILFFVNINNSYATFDCSGYDGEEHSFPDLPENMPSSHFIIRRDAYWKCWGLWVANDYSGFYVYRNGAGSIYVGDNNGFSMYRLYDNNPTSWVYVSQEQLCNTGVLSLSSAKAQFAFLTDNIYDDGELFIEANNIYDINYIEQTGGFLFYTSFIDSSISKYAYLVWTGAGEPTDFDFNATSGENDNWTFMNDEYVDDGSSIRYTYFTKKEGTYHFVIVDLEEKKAVYKDITVEFSFELIFNLSTTEKTTEPIYLESNCYYYTGQYNAENDFLNNFDVDIAYGYESTYNWAPLAVEGFDEERQENYTQYRYKVVINGVYTLRILNIPTGEITYQTFNVTNIGVENPYGEDVYYDNYNEDGEFDPSPVLFLEYVDTTTVRIRTQPFIFSELMMLECYFSSDGENYEKNSNIYSKSIDTENTMYDYNTGNKNNIIDSYYFYYDVSSDGTYYFKFYNIELKKYTVASIDVSIRDFVNSNLENIEKYPDRLIVWANEHFGILTYPFSFIVNIFGKFQNIHFTEPVLNIPELRDPFSNNKILNAVNFNSILQNETVIFIYNIYLVCVDVVFIVLFLVLCKNTFDEVFKK